MAIWDILPEEMPPLPRQDLPVEPSKSPEKDYLGNIQDYLGIFRGKRNNPFSTEKTNTCGYFLGFLDFLRVLEGLNLIPVVLELDGQGRVQARCNSLKNNIQRFVSEHEKMLADILSDMPGRKWDSMTDKVEELTNRAQAIMQKAG